MLYLLPTGSGNDTPLGEYHFGSRLSEKRLHGQKAT